MRHDEAITIAAKALDWIARTNDLLPVFLGSSGISVEQLSDNVAEPEALASVLDFLLMDDRWVLAFCSDTGISPEKPLTARVALSGGEVPHWT
ncbi:DUF3572 domain-containing protein [Qingshengfaniella alkalisoli]|uniref:DUF3572 family protein n=1 Tax=Qingshengfaniella alkalisoli TaxID=2599296 RepID=A0A5B8J597_9RHOB|nr:DUF3572 domain-containing protein [Qingshengfaniella alkalisoli]QDY69490.1 DUF3572 family protein [Qingshengfaniella alkalisoli]